MCYHVNQFCQEHSHVPCEYPIYSFSERMHSRRYFYIAVYSNTGIQVEDKTLWDSLQENHRTSTYVDQAQRSLVVCASITDMRFVVL